MAHLPNVPDAVLWHEGMLLQPQHFQHAALRADELLQYRSATLHPYNWGFVKVELDPAGMPGRIGVRALSAIMPDGLVLQLSAEDVTPYPLGGAETSGERTKVWIRVGERRSHSVPPRSTRTDDDESTVSRYKIRTEALLDQNLGRSEADSASGPEDTQLLRPVVELFVSQRPPTSSRYVSLPVAEMLWENDAWRLTEFVPPLLRLDGWAPSAGLGGTERDRSSLVDRVGEFVRRVRGAAEKRRDQLEDASPNDHERMVGEVATLAAALSVIEPLLAPGSSPHPYEVFRALVAVVGTLCALVPGTVPSEVTYDHSNPWSSYRGVIEEGQALLNEIDRDYREERMTRVADRNAYVIQLDRAWFEEGGRKLTVAAEAQPGRSEDTTKWVQHAHIAGRDFAEVYAGRAFGADRKKVESSRARAITPKLKYILFELEVPRDSAERGHLVHGDTLRIENPQQAGSPLAMFVLRPAVPKAPETTTDRPPVESGAEVGSPAPDEPSPRVASTERPG